MYMYSIIYTYAHTVNGQISEFLYYFYLWVKIAHKNDVYIAQCGIPYYDNIQYNL